MRCASRDGVKEALSYTPSVFSTRGSSTTYDVVTIRGFTTSTTVNTNQYLDGMKLQGNNYSEVSMDPYSSVEVMRGPTSVLYGNSNPGGIVSMVSKRPTTEPLKEVQFKMGPTICGRPGLTSATPLMMPASGLTA